MTTYKIVSPSSLHESITPADALDKSCWVGYNHDQEGFLRLLVNLGEGKYGFAARFDRAPAFISSHRELCILEAIKYGWKVMASESLPELLAELNQ